MNVTQTLLIEINIYRYNLITLFINYPYYFIFIHNIQFILFIFRIPAKIQESCRTHI